MFAKNLPYPLGEKELLERFGESQLKYVWVAPGPQYIGVPPNLCKKGPLHKLRAPYINYGAHSKVWDRAPPP